MSINKRIANAFGYDLIRMSKSHASLDRHLQKLFAHCGIDCVIDVGANRGQYAKKLLKGGYRGEIHSFEPVRHTFDLLTEEARSHPQWKTHLLALGDEEKVDRIHVMAHSDLSSFYSPSAYSQEQHAEAFEVKQEQEVQVRRLDTLLPEILENREDRTIYLKMDTQGFDANVFRGASGCLGQIAALQSEVSMQPFYDGMPRFDQVINEFMQAGYLVTGLYPVARDRRNLSVVEFDCVMVSGDVAHPTVARVSGGLTNKHKHDH